MGILVPESQAKITSKGSGRKIGAQYPHVVSTQKGLLHPIAVERRVKKGEERTLRKAKTKKKARAKWMVR